MICRNNVGWSMSDVDMSRIIRCIINKHKLFDKNRIACIKEIREVLEFDYRQCKQIIEQEWPWGSDPNADALAVLIRKENF